jgi:hypothetical protein
MNGNREDGEKGAFPVLFNSAGTLYLWMQKIAVKNKINFLEHVLCQKKPT